MNKKGFTLIELLAVIVVLAILALILVPTVLRIVNDSRAKANKRSVDAYGKEISRAVVEYQGDQIEKEESNEKNEEENLMNQLLELRRQKVELILI